ncbi:GNAT family N-acetyltransferase [Clavibacter nebraskensis]|uniref:Fusionprotein of two acetyltransferases n=3 Tax=Clavibacter nebraskensis TaxID=31963 RepID=A0AAI8ZJR6_9MICO|nr:GNAT family N-acetyltransferase [Clavibacter nebraskensis]CCE76273.1 fusionprotein of two acetyltransferases [Clavibacter nebraskensis NCPPB 2581]QGV67419.1 GNAT family N-acetyltransferase [Clavibacter nebraskensis]QGV70218.1 GNAT family N-acetyltransferase [Clavibacter nebraskensis]QGV73009.1 GNAT family N-acetyltransferase [Clavibacter nebraskensis]UKF28982.1 GNAT family N-acetyltransferase [Clavibacter nebraskensis]
MLTVAPESPRAHDVLPLLRQADEFALALYPAENYHALDVGDLERPGVTFLVARHDGRALGTAAVVDGGDGSAELKRVFVTDAARGLGVGRALLVAAEERSRALGADVMRLETGLPQTAAIAMYERGDYRHVPRFGKYAEDPTSVCMERDLRQDPGPLPRWILRPALPDDATWMAELRAVVLRPDLERLGRWDPVRVRRRFLDGWAPERTSVIRVDGRDVGLIARRDEPDARWIEHFYLNPVVQGEGIGGEVLRDLMVRHDDGRPFRLDVLQGSAARRLYERAGFRVEREDAVDVWLVALRADGPRARRGI